MQDRQGRDFGDRQAEDDVNIDPNSIVVDAAHNPAGITASIHHLHRSSVGANWSARDSTGAYSVIYSAMRWRWVKESSLNISEGGSGSGGRMEGGSDEQRDGENTAITEATEGSMEE